MKNRTRSTLGILGLAILALPGAVGCQTDLTEFLQALQSIEININGAVNQLQTRDPRDPDFMVPGGRNLMITEGVDLITDPSDQLDPEGFDDVLLTARRFCSNTRARRPSKSRSKRTTIRRIS